MEERSGAWRVYWRLGGRRTGEKQSVSFHRKQDAEQAKAIAEAHKHCIGRREVYSAVLGIPLEAQAPPPPKLPTVREWAGIWLSTKTRIGGGTLRMYRRQLESEILPRIGHLRLDQVDGVVVATVLQELRRTRKNSTTTRYYAVMHAMFGYAVLEKKIPDNPARRTDWIRDLVADDDIGDEHHVYLTWAEFEAIRDNHPAWLRPLVQTLVDTGGRFSEITALDVGDVVLAGPKPGVWITKGWKVNADGKWYRGATKGRNRRFVAIPKRTALLLAPLVKDKPKTELLFKAPQGGRVVHTNFRSRYWAPATVKAARCPKHPPVGAAGEAEPKLLKGPLCGHNGGVRTVGRGGRTRPCQAKVTPGWDRCASHMEPPARAESTCGCPERLQKLPKPHDLRHSHVAWLIAVGRPVLVISRRLGHHSTLITERVYAGILPSVDEQTARALDEMFDQQLAAATAGEATSARGRREAHRHRPHRRSRVLVRRT